MKKLCAKQNRRAKQWAKIENFANTSQCVRNLSEFRNGLRIWQWDCEFGNGFAKLAKWFAKLAKWFAKLAMRNFAKLLKFYVRSEVRNVLCNMASEFRNGCEMIANCLPISQWLPTGCQQFANFSMVANWLPTNCQNFCFAVFQFMLQNLHKTSKINARKIA